MTLSFPTSAIIFCAVLFSACTPSEKPRRQGKVVRTHIVQSVTTPGVIVPIRKTLVSTPYAGYIQKIFVKVGDSVRAGDPIATVTQTPQPGGDGNYPLRAPFAGTVSQVLLSVGQYAPQAGSAIARIDDTASYLVESVVPEVEINKLKKGQSVKIRASAIPGKLYNGKTTSISLSAKETQEWERSRIEFGMLVSLDDPDEMIRPGMSVVLEITTQELQNVLAIEHEFLERSAEGVFLETTNKGRVAVEIGLQNERYVEIRSGAEEGTTAMQVDYSSALDE